MTLQSQFYLYQICYKLGIWQCVKTLYPCSSHQNSWDLWMFVPLTNGINRLIGIDPYPYHPCSITHVLLRPLPLRPGAAAGDDGATKNQGLWPAQQL